MTIFAPSNTCGYNYSARGQRETDKKTKFDEYTNNSHHKKLIEVSAVHAQLLIQYIVMGACLVSRLLGSL